MKQLLLLLVAMPMLAAAQDNAKPFRIKGNLKNFPDSGKIASMAIFYTVSGSRKSDTVKVVNGKFDYKGNITEPTLVMMRPQIADTNTRSLYRLYRNMMSAIYVEPGTQKFIATGTLKNPVVKSSTANREYKKLIDLANAYQPQLDTLYSKYSAARKIKDQAGQDQAEASIDSLDALIKEQVYANYLRNNSSSPVAIYALREYAGYSMNAEKVEPIYEGLSSKIKSTPSAISFKETLETAKLTGIGKPALEFTQNDTLDIPVSLSSFRGKYVLIDFWASWCGPCRAENPNVVKVFDKYKDRNFHIVGVSLDRPGQKEKWLKAIHDDKLAWTQVSDLKFWDNEVSKLYGVRAIPQNFLIDPNGKIIAKNLRGDTLEKALQEAIDQKKAF